MIPAVPGYQRDIYKCASCEGWVARGDVFCKHCGHKFTSMDVEEMGKGSSIWKHWNAPFHTNYRETIKCVSCEGAVASTDKYCKRCGYDLSKPEQQRMVALDSEQTAESRMIGFVFFTVALVVIVLVASWLRA